ncbi:hypothetical protein [Hasllibacter sp. MH4015]|uniref:hypothetical protein n=1 Tax=Hasllibacter sp. MH4015 TaxID=2854029 RepID=UPI001CD33D9D|nr:hypothetical protein [Hasllibacter sp. MH4015]
MFWTLIAAIFGGLAGAGIGMGLRKLSRGRLNAGIVPVCAGIMMVITTVSTEYSWYNSSLAQLPADTVVVTEREQQAWYQPWTFVRPWVRGFIAFSPSETVEVAEDSGVYAAQMQVRERWQPAMVRPVLVDCPRELRFDVTPETEFNEAGQPIGATAVGEGEDDPIITSVCTASPPG